MRFESRLFQGSLAGGVDSYPQKFIVTGLPIRLLALGLVCRGLQNLVAVRLRLTLVFKVFHRFFPLLRTDGYTTLSDRVRREVELDWLRY